MARPAGFDREQARMCAMLVDALRDARQRRLIAAEKSPEGRGEFPIFTVWGLRVLKTTGGDEQKGRRFVEQATSVLTA